MFHGKWQGRGRGLGSRFSSGIVKVNIINFNNKICLKQCTYPRKENSKSGLIESVHMTSYEMCNTGRVPCRD